MPKLTYPEIRKRCLKEDEETKPWYGQKMHTVSIFLIWLLQDTRFSPNFFTLLSLLFGLAAIPCIAFFSPLSVLIGVFLIEIYYILDAVDGQWARLKNQKSITGAFFDYMIIYFLQPLICFAIGWGVFQKSGNPFYLILAFSAGLSTLWVILIWNLRAAVILQQLRTTGKTPSREKPHEFAAEKQTSSLRKGFSIFHDLMVFPHFMNVLTGSAILSALAVLVTSDTLVPVNVFSFFLMYYGIIGPIVAVILTSYWILSRKLDKAPELN